MMLQNDEIGPLFQHRVLRDVHNDIIQMRLNQLLCFGFEIDEPGDFALNWRRLDWIMWMFVDFVENIALFGK